MPPDKEKFKQISDELIVEFVDDSLSKIRQSLLDKQLDPAKIEFDSLFNKIRQLRNIYMEVDKPK